MAIENKRILMEMERVMKETNRETLNPLFPEFTIENIKPYTLMVAKARGEYLSEFCLLSQLCLEGKDISLQQANTLREKRLVYDELISASQALDTAIQRGYLDVK